MTFHSEIKIVDDWCNNAYERGLTAHHKAFWIIRDVLEGHARWYKVEKLSDTIKWAHANLRKTEQLAVVLKAVDICIKETYHDSWITTSDSIDKQSHNQLWM